MKVQQDTLIYAKGQWLVFVNPASMRRIDMREILLIAAVRYQHEILTEVEPSYGIVIDIQPVTFGPGIISDSIRLRSKDESTAVGDAAQMIELWREYVG